MFLYRLKSYRVKYERHYCNQLGHMGPMGEWVRHISRFRHLCEECAEEHDVRYLNERNEYITRKEFTEDYAYYHVICEVCKDAVYYLEETRLGWDHKWK